MSDQSELLRDLARAKAAFQLRTLELLLRDQPVSNFASDPLPETQDATPATSHVPNLGVAGNLSRGRPRDRAEPPASRRSTRKTPGMGGAHG